jgi:hypothetical protein
MICSETRLITFFGEFLPVEVGAKVWVILIVEAEARVCERGKRTGSKTAFETCPERNLDKKAFEL